MLRAKSMGGMPPGISPGEVNKCVLWITEDGKRPCKKAMVHLEV